MLQMLRLFTVPTRSPFNCASQGNFMLQKTLLSVVMLLFIVIVPLEGANWYVRPNASPYGSASGLSWNDAFNGFGAVRWGSGGVVGGDTLFVAGGSYSAALSPGASGSPGKRIVIRRATKQRHGSASGWSDGFDSQVYLRDVGITFNDNHIEVDGVVADGIKIKRNGHGTQDKGIEFTGVSTYITMRNIEIQGMGYPTAADGRGIDLTPVSGNSDSILIQGCRIYDFPNGIYLLNCRRVIIEQCKIYNMSNTAEVHENGVYSDASNDVIYRYNTMWNAAAEGVFPRSNQSNWSIYSNLFYNSWYAVATKKEYVHTNMQVHNNTFVNITYAVAFKNSGDNGSASNNLFYNCKAIMWAGLTTRTNWQNAGADPFVNRSANDYRLAPGSAAIDRGTFLESRYGIDIAGNRRGADGKWDIGAYERTSGGVVVDPPPVDTTLPPPVDTTTPPPIDSCTNCPAGSTIIKEAESGQLSDPMSTQNDTNASAGVYIGSSQSELGSVLYHIEVPQSGTYSFSARVRTGGESQNSVYIGIDGSAEDIWDIVSMPTQWSWVAVSARGSGTHTAPQFSAVRLFLTQGSHQLLLRTREKGTLLDQIRLQLHAVEQPTAIAGQHSVQPPLSGVSLKMLAQGVEPALELHLPIGGRIELTVVNLRGQQLMRIEQGHLDAGAHRFTFAGFQNRQLRGQLFYRLRVNGTSFSGSLQQALLQ
jgi:hypothetical protein